MAALVRKRAAGALMRYGVKRFRSSGGAVIPWQYRAIAAAYNNRGIIRAAGSFARRAYRRYRSRRKPYAKRSHRPQQKRSPVDGEWYPTIVTSDLLEIQTLQETRLVNIAHGTGIRERLNNQNVYIKGFKVCLRFENMKSQTPLEVHWAIVQHDDDDNNTKCFRDTTITNSRFLDFTNYDPASSSNPWQVRYLCNPLNSNKFRIITHRRFRLAATGSSTGTVQARGEFYKTVNKYIPIKRRISYSATTTDQNDRPWWLLIWYSTLTRNDFPNGTPQGAFGGLEVQKLINVYYSDGRT